MNTNQNQVTNLVLRWPTINLKTSSNNQIKNPTNQLSYLPTN